MTKFNTVELDTFRINWYLNEPIDYKKIDTPNIKILRFKSKTPSYLEGENLTYVYYYKNHKIVKTEGFQHKIDSTWTFGHNG